MSVDTEIKGEPGQVEGAADWLRHQLAGKLDDAVDRLNGARKDAESSWNSAAGDEFAGVMKRARDATDDLHSAAKDMAKDLDTFASKLRRRQNEMADVRRGAGRAGLTVAGFVVQDPGPGPERPPNHFVGTQTEVAEHNQRVRAYDDHQALVRAYNDAVREAGRVDRQYAAACRELQKDYTVSQHAAWLATTGEILGEGGAAALGSYIAGQRSTLTTRAQDLVDEAQRAIRDLQAHPERYMKRKWIFFKTIDQAKLDADKLAIQGKIDEASDLLDEAARLDDTTGARSAKILGRVGKVLGPLGLGLGIYSDYQEGESTTQIAVSQGVSFAAGVGTGVAVGAAVGSVVPVAGTAVGAVVGGVIGAGVSIFSDGAIDSLFENGPDVGKAWDAGVDALEDTGETIASGISSAADTVGGWFD